MSVKFSENAISFTKNNNNNKDKNKGVVTGVLASKVASLSASVATDALFLPYIQKLSNSLTNVEVQIVNNAFDSAVKKSGVMQKGTKIYRIGNDKAAEELTEKLVNESLTSKPKKLIKKIFGKNEKIMDGMKKALNLEYKGATNAIKNGENTFYVMDINAIAIPEKGKGLQLATFHELGHAMNKNFGKFSKFLQKTGGPIQKFGGLAILLSAITLKDKANAVDENGEKKKGVRQFIKNHAGILASLTMLPMVLEEGIASFKANKLAKETIVNAPKLLKKVKTINALGLATYILLAGATGLAAHLGVKVKDNIQERYEIKQKIKAQGKA